MGCVLFLNFFQEFARGSCRNGRITLECQIKMVIKVLAGFKFFFFFTQKGRKYLRYSLMSLQDPFSPAVFCSHIVQELTVGISPCTNSWWWPEEMISLCRLHLKLIIAVITILEFTWYFLWGVTSQKNSAVLKWSWRQLLWGRCG